jgi:hypothetical protein
MFALEEEAAARVFAFAPLISFCDLQGLGCLRWVFYLGMDTRSKMIQPGDLVYTDYNGFGEWIGKVGKIGGSGGKGLGLYCECYTSHTQISAQVAHTISEVSRYYLLVSVGVYRRLIYTNSRSQQAMHSDYLPASAMRCTAYSLR